MIKNPSSSGKLSFLKTSLLLLALGTPIVVGALIWQSIIPNNPSLLTWLLIFEVIIVLGWFFLKARPAYRSTYLQYVIYRHRFFNVKGLTTQGIFTLELERVFVALSMMSQSRKEGLGNPIQAPCEDGYMIWELLKSKEMANRHLVILGAPGSGKTTLLQHMTLILATGWRSRRRLKAPNKLPLMLFLRDQAKAIKMKPDLSLADALHPDLSKWEVQVPSAWFEAELVAGHCLVMLDGLDEVAELATRKLVVDWVGRQMAAYAKNQFIITSRPFGYYSNPLQNVITLEVCSFSDLQIRRFVHNWYLANDMMSAQMNDPGVQRMAEEGAEDLLRRLRHSPALAELAVNPLLLTMIATIHRYRSMLPGRRVQLYAEICEVFLGKRREAVGLTLDLTPMQKQRVLQSLAYHMMCRQIREIPLAEALTVIKEPLARVSPASSGDLFLKMIEHISGLLLERENGVYAFAHLTFQEYLASIYIREHKLEEELAEQVQDSWWHETIRLYAARANATGIILACLRKAQSPAALALAIECLHEAEEIDSEVRSDLEWIIEVGAEDLDSEQHRVRLEALLNLRLRRMIRFDEDQFIDNSLITHDEYQLFLDDQQAQGHSHRPDHWLTDEYAPDLGSEPVVGVRSTDALAFCDWLTQREAPNWRYRLPYAGEIEGDYLLEGAGTGYWIISQSNKEERIKCTLDKPLIAGHDNGALLDQFKQDLALARALDRSIKLKLDRNYSLFDLIRYLAGSQNRAEAMGHIHTLKLRSATHDLVIELGQGLAQDLDRDLNFIGIQPGTLQQNLGSLKPARLLGVEPTLIGAIRSMARIRDTAQINRLISERDQPPQILTALEINQALALIRVANRVRTQDYNRSLDLFCRSEFAIFNHPYAEVLNQILTIVIDRNLDQMLKQVRHQVADLNHVAGILRWYIRLLALALATECQFRLDDPQNATAWFPGRRQREKAGETEMRQFIVGCLELYTDFTILEERIRRTLPAFEGIRLVKERVK